MAWDAGRSLADVCAADGEFRLAARYWTGGLRFEAPGGVIGVSVTDGVVSSRVPDRGAPGVVAFEAAQEIWDALLAATPPRLVNDLGFLVMGGPITLHGDPVLYAQTYPAVMRAVELLRPPATAQTALVQSARHGDFDSPVGRYVHLDLAGQDHRIYFEEAGRGIPVLLQHTAGAHGAQWRHLFERHEITDHFRLIAYDLPFHGKSLPPVGPAWWPRNTD